MQKYQVLARKYRPQNFRDVVGQDTIVTTLKNALKFQKVAHAYLFCGGRGSGKTTLARLFAKSLNCLEIGPDFEPCNKCSSCKEIMAGQSLDVIEIDGASNRGIDDIRQINEMVGYVPSHGRYKIYIIDEVHMLTKEAFNALLKTLEEPPASAKFFFATTEAHKVLPTIISRCQRFDLSRISPPLVTTKLRQIAQDLGRDVSEEALFKIATLSDGSLRDAESLFDQILCFIDGKIEEDTVRQVFGLVPEEHFFSLDQAFQKYDLGYAFSLVEYLYNAGKDLSHFMSQLIDHYRLIALCKTLGEQALQSPLSAKYIQASKAYSQTQSLYLLEYLIQGESQIQKSINPRIFLENTLLHIIRSKNKIPVEVLVRRLSELEQSILSHPVPQNFQPSSCDNLKDSSQTQNFSSQETPSENDSALNTLKPVPQKQEQTHPTIAVKSDELPPFEKIKEENNQQPLYDDSNNAHTLHKAPSLEKITDTESSLQHKLEPVELLPNSPTTNDTNLKDVSHELKETPVKQQTTPEMVALVSAIDLPIEERVQADLFNETIPTKKAEESPPLSSPPKEEIKPQEVVSKSLKKSPSDEERKQSAQKHPSHYDTLMRFAAVELEGSIKI